VAPSESNSQVFPIGAPLSPEECIPVADSNTPEPTQSPARHEGATSHAARVIDTVQTVLTALILAFVFRAFMVEAFIIPTGSMAPSLLGMHATMRCQECGMEFDFGPSGTSASADPVFRAPEMAYCPNCHRYSPVTPDVAPRAGDRILVHKWPYLLGGIFGPKRWDVIVFRDPADPQTNFIKRLIGLPGETVEIVNGDVFINGEIARKTRAAQRVLWIAVYDQEYQPPNADVRWELARQRGRPSESMSSADTDSESLDGWSGVTSRVLHYRHSGDRASELAFKPDRELAYLKDIAAYNSDFVDRYKSGASRAFYGDVRIVAEVMPVEGDGALSWTIGRDGRVFTARVDRDGAVLVTMSLEGRGEVVLGSARVPELVDGKPRAVEFAHVDYRVYLEMDGRRVVESRDSDYAPNLAEVRSDRHENPIELGIVAEGLSFDLRRVRIDRDVHYTFEGQDTRRAFAGSAVKLGPDAFFVMGDNSSNSHDSREWNRIGPRLVDAYARGDYQMGTVPRDQIVGRAFFVYLPGLLPMDERGRWRIPDLGRVRFIR
jgi:signal peptidase I